MTLAYELEKKKSLKNQVLVNITSMVSPQQFFEGMHIHTISEQHDKKVLRLTYCTIAQKQNKSS